MTALVGIGAVLDAAKATLRTTFKDSHAVMVGDMYLDRAEELTGLDLLARCERASRDEYGAGMATLLLETLKAHAATVTQ